MTSKVTISVDAMGGDNGPSVPLDGALALLKERPNTHFIFFGDSAQLNPLLAERPKLEKVARIEHCDITITMDDKPSQALRRGREQSSMWQALEAVKHAEADVCISCGNTGALMAMATFCLRPLDVIARPAIAAIWPTERNESVVLDVGATVDSDASQLVDFTILGAAMARALFDMKSPSVGLLNVGTEQEKGLDAVKEAGKLLSDVTGVGFTYKGFVEGNDIGKGTVDVVVCGGFVGNIALKTAEGTARQLSKYLWLALRRGFFSRLGALLASSSFRALKSKMDPRSVNGGVFLGLNGIVIKSHGSSDSYAFYSALGLAHDMASQGLMHRIERGIARFKKIDSAKMLITQTDQDKASESKAKSS